MRASNAAHRAAACGARSADARRQPRSGEDAWLATREITVLADKSLPFDVVKKVMATCTAASYGKISLAVLRRREPSDRTPASPTGLRNRAADTSQSRKIHGTRNDQRQLSSVAGARAALAQARERSRHLSRDLRAIDAELESLATEREQHRCFAMPARRSRSWTRSGSRAVLGRRNGQRRAAEHIRRVRAASSSSESGSRRSRIAAALIEQINAAAGTREAARG